MGRVAVFSDYLVIKTLRDFIPVVGDCAYLQHRTDDPDLFNFVRTAIYSPPQDAPWPFNGSHFRQSGVDMAALSANGLRNGQGSCQGLYAFSPAGKAYGSLNTHDKDDVYRLLKYAKSAYDAEEHSGPVPQSRSIPGRPKPPLGTVILQSFARITTHDGRASFRNKYIGRDKMWILPDELRWMLRGDFPETLAARMVRYQFLDTVRGGPDKWEPDQVRLASFNTRLESEADVIRVFMEGSFRMVAPPGPNRRDHRTGPPLEETGYEGNFEGELVYNKTEARIESVNMLAEGEHWGRGVYNPFPPEGRFGLKIAFVLADDPLAEKILPGGFVSGGKDYLDPRMPSALEASGWITPGSRISN